MTSEPAAPAEAPSGRLAAARARTKVTAARAEAWADRMRESHSSMSVGFRVADRDRRVAAMVLAGGLAYRIFFWDLALSLVAAGVLGFFDPQDIKSRADAEGLGVGLAAVLAAAADSAAANEWWLLPLGIWLVLWTGYTSAKAFVLTHAAVWGVAPPRITRRLRASLIFTGGALGYIAAMAGARWLREHNTVAGLITTLLLFVVPFVTWLLASRILPNRATGWLELVPGALVVAAGEQALHLFTAYFLGPKLTSATQLYGVVGVVTTILFWFYISGRLFIGAATLNASFSEERRAGHGVEESSA